MGILYPLSAYINKTLKDIISGKKSQTFASSKEMRAIRYAEAYQKNAAVVAYLNQETIKRIQKFRNQPAEPGWDK